MASAIDPNDMMGSANRSLTSDTLFNGRLICDQHLDGYRFSVDAVLLSHFLTSYRDGSRVLDLGAGCGVISLLLAYRWPQVSVTALEVQKPLAQLCAHNVRRNNFDGRISVVEGDLRRIELLLRSESFDVVMVNPPYRRKKSGRKNPGREQMIARHEVLATIADVAGAASYAVKNKGKVVVVYPASRLPSLLNELVQNRLQPKRLQIVYSYPEGPAQLVLVEAVKNGGEELAVLPPLFIYSQPGGRRYSKELQALYLG